MWDRDKSNPRTTNGDVYARPVPDVSHGTTVAAAAAADENDASSSKSGVILGGGMRATVLLLAKKMSLKSMLRKRAFLLIGGTTDGSTRDNKSITRKSRSVLHGTSRPVVYAEASLMGMMVFGTYDILIHCYDTFKLKHGYSTVEDDSMEYYDTFGRLLIKTPEVVVHSLAGGAAGVARTIFWMGWEAAVHRNFWVRDHPKFCIRNTIHHATGYGCLFGSFQFTRQTLLFLDPISLLAPSSLDLSHNNSGIESERSTQTRNVQPFNYETAVPMIYTATAGGFAGQTHHIVQHYTNHWKQFSAKPPPLPRLYPTLSSFATMSLCFLAFEHGPQIVDGWTEEIIETIDFIMTKYSS